MSEIVIILVAGAGLALLVSLILAPLEALGWWAGWLGPVENEAIAPGEQWADADPAGTDPPSCYIVFLSGIAAITGDELLKRDALFLARLRQQLPQARFIADVFPYAPSGRSLLTGQRAFAWLWRQVRGWRHSRRRLLPMLLNIRNLLQVLVSADRRYGPVYSYGASRLVIERLNAHGYQPGCGIPVILLAISGGAQISLGAATYLRAAGITPLRLITVGGVMSSDRGVAEIAHLTRLFGERDWVEKSGAIMFPGRWPLAYGSFWNAALRENRIEARCIGAMKHSGSGGYMDPAPGTGGTSNLERTVRAVCEAVRETDAAR